MAFIRRKNKKIWLFLLVIFSVIILLLLYIVKVVNPIILNLTKAQVESLTYRSINSAVSDVINVTINYENVIDVVTNDNGDVVLMKANQYVINAMTREIVKVAMNNMQKVLLKDSVDLPIGSFTGIPLFAGRGPNLHIKVVPIGVVSNSYRSEFTSIGINNTLHSLYLNLRIDVSLILPVKSYTINCNTDVLLCESVIVGKIPDTYLNADSLDNMLDLVP